MIDRRPVQILLLLVAATVLTVAVVVATRTSGPSPAAAAIQAGCHPVTGTLGARLAAHAAGRGIEIDVGMVVAVHATTGVPAGGERWLVAAPIVGDGLTSATAWATSSLDERAEIQRLDPLAPDQWMGSWDEERLGRCVRRGAEIHSNPPHDPRRQATRPLRWEVASVPDRRPAARLCDRLPAVYLERGEPVTVLGVWGLGRPPAPAALYRDGFDLAPTPPAPRNVLVRRAKGVLVIRPFRGLRRPPAAKETPDAAGE